MKARKICRWGSRCLVAVAFAAGTAAPAQAMHAPAAPRPATSSAARVDAATRHHHPDVAQSPTRIVAVAPAQSFDWGDAGIGAGGALGAVLLAGGSALLVKRNHRQTITARSAGLGS
jgi:hypothetical protein